VNVKSFLITNIYYKKTMCNSNMSLPLLEYLKVITIRRSKPTRSSINTFVFHVVFF
jgi:hypothetical protein